MPTMPAYHRPPVLGAKRDTDKIRDERRGSSAERGYDRRWLNASRTFRRRNPLCCCCKANGIVAASEVTDHVIPHEGDPVLLRDEGNWQALCSSCHNTIKKRFEALWKSGKATVAELRLDRRLPDFFDLSAPDPRGGSES